jgi:hypothetical protein
MPDTDKTYLGDGVYAYLDELGQVVLITSNGIVVTNTVVLENEVIGNFLTYLNYIKKVCNDS